MDERRQALRDRPLHDWSSHAADASATWRWAARAAEERMPKLRYDDRGIV